MKQELLYQLLDRAQGEEMGIAVETNNAPYLQLLLQKAKRDSMDHLIVCLPSLPNMVFICQPTIELETLP